MRYEILDDQGNVINTIIANTDFVAANYAGRFREAPAPVLSTDPSPLSKLTIMRRTIQGGEWAKFRKAALEGLTDNVVPQNVLTLIHDGWDLFTSYPPNEMIHPNDPLTTMLFGALVAAGVISDQSRVNAILSPE